MARYIQQVVVIWIGASKIDRERAAQHVEAGLDVEMPNAIRTTRRNHADVANQQLAIHGAMTAQFAAGDVHAKRTTGAEHAAGDRGFTRRLLKAARTQ